MGSSSSRACHNKAWPQHKAEFRGFLANQNGNADEATDLPQEIFLNTLLQGEDFCRLDNSRSWLFHVAHNLLVDRLRLSKEQIPLPVDLCAESAPEFDPIDFLSHCPPRVLTEFSPEDRDAILLCDMQGATQKEYAARLGLSLCAAKSRVRGTRLRLRSTLLVPVAHRFVGRLSAEHERQCFAFGGAQVQQQMPKPYRRRCEMAGLGKGAMVLLFDVSTEAAVEHDDWHTHEHLPERLSIPGFLRGTRWLAQSAKPRYFVMYEVSELAVLASPSYLERLNNPSSWTAKMMKHYRGMNRGLCQITASFGHGLGQTALLIRLSPIAGKEAWLREWLTRDALPAFAARPGLVSAQLFEAALKSEITEEQRIRGKDAGIDWVLLVTGYSPESLELLCKNEFSDEQLERRGAAGLSLAIYHLGHCLTDREVAPH